MFKCKMIFVHKPPNMGEKEFEMKLKALDNHLKKGGHDLAKSMGLSFDLEQEYVTVLESEDHGLIAQGDEVGLMIKRKCGSFFSTIELFDQHIKEN